MSGANNKLARLARPHAEFAIQRLVAIVGDGYESTSARVDAARTLLEFGYGQPTKQAHRRRASPVGTMPRLIQVNWGEPSK